MVSKPQIMTAIFRAGAYFFCRGGVYPRPQTSIIAATGGDKPRPYIVYQVFIEFGQCIVCYKFLID